MARVSIAHRRAEGARSRAPPSLLGRANPRQPRCLIRRVRLQLLSVVRSFVHRGRRPSSAKVASRFAGGGGVSGGAQGEISRQI